MPPARADRLDRLPPAEPNKLHLDAVVGGEFLGHRLEATDPLLFGAEEETAGGGGVTDDALVVVLGVDRDPGPTSR